MVQNGNAVGERIAGPLGRQLIDGPAAARKLGCSYRHWLRMADASMAPRGVKLGSLRRWDVAEIDAWIAAGCPRVGSAR